VVRYSGNVDETLLNHTTVTQLFSNSLKTLEPDSGENEDEDEEGEDEDEDEDESEAGTEHANISLRNSPFNYAVSYWLKHAMDVPCGMNSTSRSKELWELVKDLFWDNSGTGFDEWLRTFSPNMDSWHLNRHSEISESFKCLYDRDYKWEVSSCLHVAASYGLVDILDWAHPEGLDFDIKGRSGMTPLMYAAFVGEIDAAKAILSKGGVNVNLTSCQSSDCNGRHDDGVGTALQYAIYSGCPEMMELLLKQPGIEVDYEFHGTTALGVAIKCDYPEEIQLLVGAGAKLAMWYGRVLAIPSSS
jgi:hypothetical protein